MGSIHNELRRTTLSDALTRALGDSRGVGGIERYGETLTPGIDLWSRPEFAWLRLEYNWMTAMTITAVIGQQGGLAIALPPDSNAIAVISGFRHSSSSGVAGRARLSHQSRANLIVNGYTGRAIGNRDQRMLASPVAFSGAPPLIEALAGTSAVSQIQSILADVNVLANTADHGFHTPIVIKPGGAIVLEETQVNTELTANFWGYVRSALPGELSG